MSSLDTTMRKYHDRFSAPDADIVCVSQDGVAFRIPSITLRMTSGFFRSTLSLPQPQPDDTRSSSASNDESIFLSEPQSVLERLFSIICGLGILPPELGTFEDVTTLLHAAEKYEMRGVLSIIQGMITQPRFLRDPLRVYGLSCRYGWTEEAKVASALTLELDLSDTTLLPIVSTLRGKDLINLLHIRWKRREELSKRLNELAGSQEPCHCLCGREVNPYGWREWKLIILEEFMRDASGKSILSHKFLSSRKADAALGQTCPHSDCGKVIFSRESTLRHLLDSVHGLPSTIELEG